MNRFQSLLLNSAADVLPADRQAQAERLLPQTVQDSRLRWWSDSSTLTMPGDILVILVGTYSHYDLALLDLLEAEFAQGQRFLQRPQVPVYVANLFSYDTVEQLQKDFPLIKSAPPQTPVVMVHRNGRWDRLAVGKPGRDLVASTLDLSAEDLNRRVVDRVPVYRPT